MTYTQAKLIIWNPGAYRRTEVREACLFILSKINAAVEDVHRATFLL